MVNRVLLRKLMRDLASRKGSLVVLVLVVAIGVGSYAGMDSVYRDLQRTRKAYYRDYQLADFTVDLKRMPDAALEEIAQLPNVRDVRGRVSLGVLVDLPGVAEPVSGLALSCPERPRPVINDIMIQTGGWFSGRDDREVILNHEFAEANGLVPGDRLKVLLLDKQHELLVVGTAMSPEFIYVMPPGGGFAPDPKRHGIMYMTEDFLRKSCDLDGAWNQVVGTAHDASRIALDNLLVLIEDRLDAYGVTNTTPVQEQASPRFLADELAGLEKSAKITPLIFLAVAALVLNVLIGRMVAQQRMIIGTLKAVGYTSGAILRHYLAFGAAVGLAGATVGAFAGYWMQVGMLSLYRDVYKMPGTVAHIYPHVYLQAFAFSMFFALAGTVKGVRAAAKLEPAEVMHPPPPEKGARILLERVPFFWNPMPFRWKMIMRTVFRNPFRSTVSIFAAMVSTAMIYMTLSNLNSMYYMIDYQFEKIAHEDMTVSLRDPEQASVRANLGGLSGVAYTEPQLGVTCDLSHGPYSKRTAVLGLPKDGRLFTPLDVSGAPVTVPDAGLILTKKLSEILHAGPGDVIRLRALVGRRREVASPVVGVVNTYLGLSAYADIEYLSRLLGEERSANVILADLTTVAPSSSLLDQIKRRPVVVGLGERQRSITQVDEMFGESIGVMISIMVLFAGMIAFGSVLNTALVSLSEREREVGTLRVLGYTSLQVQGIFSGESLLLNSIGVGLGLVLGIGMAYLFSFIYNTELYRFPFTINPVNFLIAGGLMAFFILLAQSSIYRIITRLQWLDVLKIKE